MLFLFRELGSTGNYFRGSGEQAHSFRGFSEPCQKVKKVTLKILILKEKPPFCLIFRKNSLASGGPKTLLINCNSLFTCTSRWIEDKKQAKYICSFLFTILKVFDF